MDSFKEKMALGDQMEMTSEYAAFVEKFKPKKTTDDCYTPDNVYAAVLDWAVKEYGLEGARIIRPFYPGGDYQSWRKAPAFRHGDISHTLLPRKEILRGLH